jgi:hypothetical protein
VVLVFLNYCDLLLACEEGWELGEHGMVIKGPGIWEGFFCALAKVLSCQTFRCFLSCLVALVLLYLLYLTLCTFSLCLGWR